MRIGPAVLVELVHVHHELHHPEQERRARVRIVACVAEGWRNNETRAAVATATGRATEKRCSGHPWARRGQEERRRCGQGVEERRGEQRRMD